MACSLVCLDCPARKYIFISCCLESRYHKVVDVEKILPPVILTDIMMHHHPGGLGSSGKQLDEGGVEEEDHCIDTGEANVAMDIIFEPEKSLAICCSAFICCLVQLL